DVDMCVSPSPAGADAGCEHPGCRRRSAYIESVDNIKSKLVSSSPTASPTDVRSVGDLDVHERQTGQHLVKCDGKIAHANSGGVEHRIRHGPAGPANAQLTNALGAKRVGFVVEPIEQYGVDLGDVGVHRHQVLSEVP